MLKRVDHIGVIVEDLDQVKRFLRDTFGLSLERDVELPDRLTKAAFFRCGDVDIEVIEVAEDEERGRRLGGAQARIEHIAIEVDDLEATLRTLEGRGVQMRPFTFRAGANLSALTDPSSSLGITYQLIQKG
jgi:methylmalonyl-CoA/ethylmalonyl-CoA epimerase